jgi:hypothetical protein
MLVLHHCDEPACVNPSHLFVGTDLTNTADKIRKGRQARGPEHSRWARGEKMHMAKLTEAQVLAIRADNRAQRVIGEQYGITQSHVCLIKKGEIWKHI